MIHATATLTAIFLMLIPALVAFARHHKYKWWILALAIIPSYGFLWVAALIWACWPNCKR